MSDDMSTFDDFDDDAFIRDSSDGLFDFDVDEPLIATDMCSLDEQEGLFSFDSTSMGMAFALAEDISESDRIGYGFSSRRNSRMNDSFRTRCLNDGFDDDEIPMDPEELYVIKFGECLK